MKNTLPCEIINANQGAIDNFSCKQCRKSIVKQLCILLGVPIGGIVFYSYAFVFSLYLLDLSFTMSIDSLGFWISMSFLTLWFLTNRIAFSVVDGMNYVRAFCHCQNHNTLDSIRSQA